MSWSISAKGTKEVAKTQLVQMSKSSLQAYAGKPEADDISAALDRANKLIDAMPLGEDGYGYVHDGVQVYMHGSHTTGASGLMAASFSVNVVAVNLKKA